MLDETTIFHAKIWNHPIESETTILKVDVSNSRTKLIIRYVLRSELKFPKKIVFDENVFVLNMVFGLSGITNQIDQSGMNSVEARLQSSRILKSTGSCPLDSFLAI